VSNEKKTRGHLLSMKYWLCNRDPYNGLWHNFISCIYIHTKQPEALFSGRSCENSVRPRLLGDLEFQKFNQWWNKGEQMAAAKWPQIYAYAMQITVHYINHFCLVASFRTCPVCGQKKQMVFSMDYLPRINWTQQHINKNKLSPPQPKQGAITCNLKNTSSYPAFAFFDPPKICKLQWPLHFTTPPMSAGLISRVNI